MFSRKDFKENLEAAGSIKDLASIYQEIASLQMNQIKDKVAQTRQFLDGVATVYNHAKVAYIANLQAQSLAGGNKDWRETPLLRRNGKTVLVLLSANEHLYGSLIRDTYREFAADLVKSEDEAAVVGTFGKYLVKNEANLENRITFFDLADDKPEVEKIKKITSFLAQYEQVIVYHGQLVSLLTQEPVKEQISGGVTLEEKVQAKKRYLFEPSTDEILGFFESEIIAALFNQKVYEHLLARLASRVLSMDQATENAKQFIKKVEGEYKNLERRTANKKLLEIFAGYSLWSSGKEESGKTWKRQEK